MSKFKIGDRVYINRLVNNPSHMEHLVGVVVTITGKRASGELEFDSMGNHEFFLIPDLDDLIPEEVYNSPLYKAMQEK